jgi:hypothetical protein
MRGVIENKKEPALRFVRDRVTARCGNEPTIRAHRKREEKKKGAEAPPCTRDSWRVLILFVSFLLLFYFGVTHQEG